MELFPAIDLRQGQVVRLTQGDYQNMVVYSDDPTQIAQQFEQQGAKHLHVVDLDGAKEGSTKNFDVIKHIADHCSLTLQVGGGIRDQATIERYLAVGIGRVILGSIAAQSLDFVRDMIATYGKQIAVGVDARNGFVSVHGWLTDTKIEALSFCEQLDQAGVSTIIYTDISCDGTMQGCNQGVYQTLQKRVTCDIIASGGIASLQELELLLQIGLYGAILGKSLYTGTIDLRQAVSLC